MELSSFTSSQPTHIPPSTPGISHLVSNITSGDNGEDAVTRSPAIDGDSGDDNDDNDTDELNSSNEDETLPREGGKGKGKGKGKMTLKEKDWGDNTKHSDYGTSHSSTMGSSTAAHVHANISTADGVDLTYKRSLQGTMLAEGYNERSDEYEDNNSDHGDLHIHDHANSNFNTHNYHKLEGQHVGEREDDDDNDGDNVEEEEDEEEELNEREYGDYERRGGGVKEQGFRRGFQQATAQQVEKAKSRIVRGVELYRALMRRGSRSNELPHTTASSSSSSSVSSGPHFNNANTTSNESPPQTIHHHPHHQTEGVRRNSSSSVSTPLFSGSVVKHKTPSFTSAATSSTNPHPHSTISSILSSSVNAASAVKTPFPSHTNQAGKSGEEDDDGLFVGGEGQLDSVWLLGGKGRWRREGEEESYGPKRVRNHHGRLLRR